MSMSSGNDRINEASMDELEEGYLVGTVIANNDPLGLNRVQVTIPDILDSNQGPVPWIGPHAYSPFGQGSGYGVYGSPAVGSEVKVKFQEGKANYGFYEASL